MTRAAAVAPAESAENSPTTSEPKLSKKKLARREEKAKAAKARRGERFIVKFNCGYGTWQKGDIAGFDRKRALELCGVTALTPKGSDKAVAAPHGIYFDEEFKEVKEFALDA